MSTHAPHLQPPPGAAADEQREPVGDAVLEVSARLVTLDGGCRRLKSRLDELCSAEPALRRRPGRALPPDPLRPLTIFSIEEADSGDSGRQVHGA